MVRLVPVFVLALAACNPDGDTSDTSSPGDEVASRYTLTPPSAGIGTQLEVRVSANVSSFDFGVSNLDLGEGITVESVTVEDGFNMVALVTIADDAALGARDATVTVEDSASVLSEAFTVVGESFKLDPDNARMGELLDVAIVGKSTAWTQGTTWPGFGDDVEIMDFDVLSSTLAVARIAVAPDARPGHRDVSMEDGPKVTTAYDAFTVDRAVITATWDPAQAYQGDTVAFTITGVDTNWVDGTAIEFWHPDGGQNTDIEITQLTILDAKNMYGRMRLSNAARIGFRDVLIRGGDEAMLIPDAFQVLDAPPDLSNIYVGTSFDVTRQIDPSTCEIAESVTALTYFVIPLDPPCGSSPPPGMGPMPYDNNGVFPSPPEAEPVDCPNPETVSAGDYVWYEGDNVVTLPKDIIRSTGQIIYRGVDLTLEDYMFDQLYALHTQGDPEGIPEVVVPDVQPTVPADYYLLTPDFCNLVVDRNADFTYEWTPAQTYPDAIFSTSISTTLVATGEGGFAGSIPWDDGVHTYTPAELLQLNSGPASFSASSYIKGPYFGLPFSTIQTCQSDSTLGTGASLTLK